MRSSCRCWRVLRASAPMRAGRASISLASSGSRRRDVELGRESMDSSSLSLCCRVGCALCTLCCCCCCQAGIRRRPSGHPPAPRTRPAVRQGSAGERAIKPMTQNFSVCEWTRAHEDFERTRRVRCGALLEAVYCAGDLHHAPHTSCSTEGTRPPKTVHPVPDPKPNPHHMHMPKA